MTHLVEPGFPPTDGSWNLQILVTDMNIQRYLSHLFLKYLDIYTWKITTMPLVFNNFLLNIIYFESYQFHVS